jgi:hypothetical protein
MATAFYIPTSSSLASSTLSGDVLGTTGANYISDNTVTSKLLTGMVITPGTITSSDSIRSAMGKLASGQTAMVTNSIESAGTTLNIATANNTQTLNLGSGTGVQTINIGNSGVGATTINIGGSTDTVTAANLSCTGNITTSTSAGLNLYHPGGAGTYGPSKLTVVNALNKNGLVLDTTGSTYALTDIVSRVSASLSMNQRFDTRTGYVDAVNLAAGEYQVWLNSSASKVAYFGTNTCGISGSLIPQTTIAFPNMDTRKRLTLWDAGDTTSLTDHRFNGLGKASSMMLYQVNATTDDHVFYAATSASASNELFRIKGTGAVTCPGTFNVGGVCSLGAGVSVTGSASVQYGITSGTIVTAPTITATTAMTTPSITLGGGTVLTYYEEYVHFTTFNGPVTTDNTRCTIIQVGKLVTLHVPVGVTGNTVTSGQINLTMTTQIPTRFRMTSGGGAIMTTASGYNNSVGPVYFRVTQDTMFNIVIVGGTTAFAGQFSISSFSLTWSLV